MTSESPYYWANREAITVSAWYPYAETMPVAVVLEDQSIRKNYVASDFISAEGQNVDFNTPASLKFSHRTARITLNLQAGAGVDNVADAAISLLNLSTDNGNPAAIRPYNPEGDTYDALLVPQTIASDREFIRIELNGNVHTARLSKETEMKAGFVYTYNVTVTDKGLKVEEGSILNWTEGGSETGIASVMNYDYDASSNTYTVYTAEGLYYWAEAARNDLSTNCILAANIPLEIPAENGSNWTTLGDYTNSYSGVFEGNGHSISNLTISGGAYQGIFGTISESSEVRNLTLIDVNISGSQYIGAITGGVKSSDTNQGKIYNCSVTGTVNGSHDNSYTGGFAGYSQGIIQACQFSGTVKGVSYLGGIVGKNEGSDALVIACSTQGKIECTADVWSQYGRILKNAQYHETIFICLTGLRHGAAAPRGNGLLAGRLLCTDRFRTPAARKRAHDLPRLGLAADGKFRNSRQPRLHRQRLEGHLENRRADERRSKGL